MRPHGLYRWKTGENLAPRFILENLRSVARDIQDLRDRRYTYSSYVLDFTTLSSVDPIDSRFYIIPAPWGYDIVGIEMVVVSTASGNTFSLLVNDIVGGQGTVVTVPVTAIGQRFVGSSSNVVSVGANNSLVALLDVTGAGAWTLTACKAVVHIRTSRMDTTPFDLEDYQASLPRSGLLTSNTDLNTIVSDASARISALNGVENLSRSMQVVTRRHYGAGGALTANLRDTRVPASGRRYTHLFGGLVCAVTSAVTFSLRNTANAANLISTALTGTGATNLTTSVTPQAGATTQGVTDPDDPTDDNYARIDRTTGTDAVNFAYLVLFNDR